MVETFKPRGCQIQNWRLLLLDYFYSQQEGSRGEVFVFLNELLRDAVMCCTDAFSGAAAFLQLKNIFLALYLDHKS